jgi:tight adherence protein C
VSAAVSWAVVLGVALGVGLWALVSLLPRFSRPRLARRVAPYLADVSPAARASLSPAPPGPLPVIGVLFEPVLARGRALLGSALGGSETIARRLRQAGSPLTVEGFRSQQVLAGLGGAAAGVVLVVAGARIQPVPLVVQAVAVIVFAALGVVGRDLLLQRAARQRMSRLSDELPVVLEFLTLSLAAGEGIVDATRRVARAGRGELASELAGVVASVGTGLPFGETLAALARELELPSFSRAVEQLVGALERGTPLAEVLRAQAQDAREQAKRDLLETAGKKEVAMLVPLVFLILPVTIAFAIFPGVFVLQVGF